ncbi:hypothetical protein O59_004130 [Cellvibrio sp. BR]|nr:hypothetical protein O59_004130 [Cellvibrio sp. BR]
MRVVLRALQGVSAPFNLLRDLSAVLCFVRIFLFKQNYVKQDALGG